MNQVADWGIEVNAQDFFGHQKKQLQVADRRPVIRKASDLVGPGIATAAIRITDFNNLLATFNGYYSADVEALSAPNATDQFVGHVVMDDELGGRQVFTSLDTGEEYTRIFLRSPSDADFISFGLWRSADYVLPTTYSIEAVSSSVPDLTATFMTPPQMDVFGTSDTFERTPTAVLVKRPGLYSGVLRMRASSTAFIADRIVIHHPDGSTMSDTDLFIDYSFGTGLLVPLHFWTSETTGYVRVEVEHSTGITRSASWSNLNLSRIGDAPA